MRNSRTILTLIFSLLFSASLFANGLSLNGVGTKSTAMGGAFVGLANDLTAIYWNPAGLAGQNSGVSVFATDIIPFANYKYDTYGVDASAKTNHYIGPNLFANYQMGAWAFGLGLYVPAGLGSEWDGADLVAFGGPAFLDPGQTMANPFAGKEYKWRTKLGVFSISPSVAYQVNDQFSVGLAVNIYYGMFDMERAVDAVDITHGAPAAGEDGMMDNQYDETSTGTGYGVTIGLKYNVSEMFSVGATFRSKSTIAFSGTVTNTAFAAYGAEESDFDRDISWPMWLALGLAYHPMDVLTLTADVQYSQWSESSKEIVTDYKNQIWDGAIDQQGKNVMTLDWKDAIQYRIGMEYKAMKNMALRLGYYYDPAPAPDETLNILFPSSTNNSITGGLCYGMGNVSLMGAVEYLFGAERDVAPAAENMPGKHQMDIFVYSVGLNYFFK